MRFILVIIPMICVLFACGPQEVTVNGGNGSGPSETNGAPDVDDELLRFARAYAEVTADAEVELFVEEHQCECDWEDDGYDSHQSCRDDRIPGEGVLEQVLEERTFCLAEVLDEMDLQGVDLASLAQCYEDAVSESESCVEELDIECGDSGLQVVECSLYYFELNSECDEGHDATNLMEDFLNQNSECRSISAN